MGCAAVLRPIEGSAFNRNAAYKPSLTTQPGDRGTNVSKSRFEIWKSSASTWPQIGNADNEAILITFPSDIHSFPLVAHQLKVKRGNSPNGNSISISDISRLKGFHATQTTIADVYRPVAITTYCHYCGYF